MSLQAKVISDTVRQLPTADLQMALAELADDVPPPERRHDLEQFAVLIRREVATALDKTTEQLTEVARQVDHVHKILGDQECFMPTVPASAREPACTCCCRRWNCSRHRSRQSLEDK